MKLDELQRHFFNAVFEHDISEALLQEIKESGHRDGIRALEIYRSSIQGNYLACLRRIYRVCLALVGEEFFNALAARYISITPSRSENLNHYGESFSQFIKQFPHAQSLPYLADIAQLEWFCHEVSHAEGSPKLENEHWQALLNHEQLENIVFCLPKALRLMESQYPIQKIWYVHQQDGIPHDMIDLESGGDRLIILRREQQIELVKVTEDAWLLLQLIQSQHTFGEICIAFSEKNFNVVSLVPEAVKQEWIIGFTRQGS